MSSDSNRSILFIVAHPFLERSRANRAVMTAVEGVPGLTVRRLYDLYPYFHIDVAAEQRLMSSHDLIVVQHPFYWYSMPALLKQWLDEVWLSGWAYGPGGDKLQGKHFLLSLTVGGNEEAYSSQGINRFSMDTLLAPWNQTIHLCKMKWHQPQILHGAIRAGGEELERHALSVRDSLLNFAHRGVLK
jgi:glutathione-regulated potassium-efflux system ancillary protein KefG